MESVIFYLRVFATILLISLCALSMLIVAIPTLFLARRLYAEWVQSPFGRLILQIWGIQLVVHKQAPFPEHQTVYVFNHTSIMDFLILTALRLPNSRFFLYGFYRWSPPFAVIGFLTGIFWTVDQVYQEKRVRIFQRACQILKRTGESVCLSPEGRIVTEDEIGSFNKGAFHLAAALGAPMWPLYIYVPPDINPGKGWHVRPGTVDVYVGDQIDTSEWHESDAAAIKEQVRDRYVLWKKEIDGHSINREVAPGYPVSNP